MAESKKKKLRLNQSTKKVISISLLVVLVGVGCFFVGREVGLNTDTSSTQTIVSEVKAEKKNLSKTTSSSGEIVSSLSEDLALSTDLYFEKMLVEEGDLVASGEEILEYTDGSYLTAPYDLVITGTNIPNTGEKVSSSNSISVSKTSDLVIELNINENEISDIAIGQAVKITLTADESKTYDGEISDISAIGDYSSSGATFTIKATFKNDGAVKLGMSATCEITLMTAENVIAVPVDAVIIEDDKRYVEKITNGNVEKIEVETGISDGEYVEITKGLDGNETLRVTTEVTESVIRETEEGGMKMNSGSGSGGFDPSSLPEGMESGSGTPPEMPSEGGEMKMPGGGQEKK